MKKFLKWTGITLFFLIILIILVPILFKDQLKELVIKEVNKTLTAKLELDDFDLTFFSTFPNVTIELKGARLTGTGDFNGVKLAEIKRIEAHVGLWDVVAGDQIEIDEVHIYDPSFDVRVLQDGRANWDIVKPDSLMTEEELEEPSSFKLSLQEYSINNANIIYDDRAYNMFVKLDSLNHTGKGDLTADIIDFETTTQMSKMSYRMDGIDYLTEVNTDANVNIRMEFTDKSSKFTLQENSIKLNAVKLSIDGFYEMFEDRDEMDLKLDASESSFKDLLSLIPTFYTEGYEGMLASGKVALNGEVKGKMTETDLPGWDFGMKVSNASIKYPDLPGKITNIQVDAGSKFTGGSNMDNMTVDIPKFHANLSKNSLDANLFLRNIMTDPNLKSKILAKLDLSTLKDFVPMGEEKYTGKLDADVDINGRMSDLENGDFEKFKAEGVLQLYDMLYQSPSTPDDVNIKKMKFTFAPQALTLNELDAKMGSSDFRMNGAVDNYFGYLLRDETLKGNFNFNSNFIDADKIMAGYDSGESSAETTTEPTGESEVILVPDNIDFALNTSIDKLRYNNMDFKDINGKVSLKEEVASLDNLTMKAMGGTVGLHGSYDTQDHATPKLDFGYKLQEIDIQTLAKNFITVEKLAPIAKYATGKISSNLDMKSDLTPSFEPILSSLSSIGDLTSNAIKISNVKLFDKIEKVTKLDNFNNQELKNFKTKFSVQDGKVTMLPFDTKIDGMNTNISGYTTLDQQMNYTFKVDVPKEKIPASMVKEVESAMSKLNALVPKLDIGKLPAIIPVNILATGDVKDPKITTDFKEAILKATGDFKDNLINSVTETVKDTVKAVIDNTVKDAKEEIEKQKQKIISDAQKEADKLVAEAKVAADKIRAEAKKQGDALIAEAGSNPIKKKTAEVTAKKLNDEAEKKAQKVEAEAQAKADDIMRKARERADKLG